MQVSPSSAIVINEYTYLVSVTAAACAQLIAPWQVFIPSMAEELAVQAFKQHQR